MKLENYLCEMFSKNDNLPYGKEKFVYFGVEPLNETSGEDEKPTESPDAAKEANDANLQNLQKETHEVAKQGMTDKLAQTI